MFEDFLIADLLLLPNVRICADFGADWANFFNRK